MTYRRIAEEEQAAAMAALSLGFGIPGEAEGWSSRTEPEQVRVVEVDGAFASVLRIERMGQYWLGRPVPSAQVLSLATSPEHRGQGHGAALLEGLFAELRDDGVPTVTLQPSTARFYRSVGFEFAGAWSLYEVDCQHVPPLDPSYRIRRLPAGELGPVMDLYERVAPGRQGAFARNQRWWRARLARPQQHEDKEAVAFLLERPDGPVGWAMLAFSVDVGPDHEPKRLRVRVQDWGCLPGHDLALPGVLAGYRTMEGVVAWSGPDPDPMLYLLPNESVRLMKRRHWMLRLVDLAGALGARPYPPAAAGRVAFEVEDRSCPWNTGAWSFEVEGGKALVERVPAGTAGATADPRGLATLFSGFSGPDELVRVGLLAGLSPADLDLLRAAFASPRPFTAELY